jgi:hypothetical protein
MVIDANWRLRLNMARMSASTFGGFVIAELPARTLKGLTPEQREHFFREGFLMVPDIFTDADLQPVIDEVSAKIDELANEYVAAGKLSRSYAEYGFEHRLAKINTETNEIASQLWDARLALPSFFDLMRTPRLLDIAEDLCGPELVASSVYRLRPKAPGHKKSPVPWHQDSGYFEPTCDNSLVLTVWLPLVNATEENGCMWVLPRGHTPGKVVQHHAGRDGKPYLEIYEEDLPKTGEPLCVPVPKGGALLMTNLLPHASFDNRTDGVRWSMDLRYQSAALPTNADISRLPGESTEPMPGACYPPEKDFLIRSAARPEEVVTTREQFVSLRKTHVAKPATNRWNWPPK